MKVDQGKLHDVLKVGAQSTAVRTVIRRALDRPHQQELAGIAGLLPKLARHYLRVAVGRFWKLYLGRVGPVPIYKLPRGKQAQIPLGIPQRKASPENRLGRRHE